MEITINEIIVVKLTSKDKKLGGFNGKIIKNVDFIYTCENDKLVVLKSKQDSPHHNFTLPTYLLMQDLFSTLAGRIFQISDGEVIHGGLTKLKPSDVVNNPSIFKRLDNNVSGYFISNIDGKIYRSIDKPNHIITNIGDAKVISILDGTDCEIDKCTFYTTLGELLNTIN